MFSFAISMLWFGADGNTINAAADEAAPQATFAANAGTLGAIPDGPAACTSFGANRDVTFTVSGLTAPLTNVSVNFTLAPAHTWVGDLDVRLIAPGGAPEHVIFSRTGATAPTQAGTSSDAGGPFTFADTAPAAPTWWAAAATNPIPSGSYRSSTAGEVAGGGANTLITPAFAGLSTAQINGTWTLRFRDHCAADTGSVSAANLTLDAGAPIATDAPLDFDDDGKSDYVVVRNAGGGSGGQVRWFWNRSSTNTPVSVDWGISTDFFVTQDFDGDGKNDAAVYRPTAAPNSYFYILNSADNTLRQESLGATGDDPTIVDDYDGDGKADVAVYRGGASAGQPSFWYFRGTLNNPGGNITFLQWGQNGDFPMPGDRDGDGKADFTVQRNNGSGSGQFWTRTGVGTFMPVVTFGTSSDLILPADYDGDGKTDICVARGSGGQIIWHWIRSSDGVIVGPIAWGLSATDFPVQGDYDGDGKAEPAIWRPNADTEQNYFYSRNSTDGALKTFELGRQGDYPVGNYNSH
jgi:hypothetical protein